jgi:serine/threonine protein kinase
MKFTASNHADVLRDGYRVERSHAPADRDERISQAIGEFLSAAEAGAADRSVLLAKYSDIAEELTGCLEAFDFMSAVAPQLVATDAVVSRGFPGIAHPASGVVRGSPDGVVRGSPDPAHPASDIGLLGDFRILRELGRGGMGVVYEAEQISLGRRVALKVLPFAAMLDRQQLARFKNEARAAATLVHPNIVAIYSVGYERGVHYYAMQLIEGQSLAQVVEQLRRESGRAEEQQSGSGVEEQRSSGVEQSAIRIPQSEIATQPIVHLPTLHAPSSSLPAFATRDYFRTVAQLGIQAAEALDYAHQNGVLHRDIKPANLLVDDTGKLWITDFGLARLETDAGMTMTGDILGTLRYMSPEQALAQRAIVDYRSDIYSLGVTLYELLTLRPAFLVEDRQELLRKIAFEDPPALRAVNRQITVELETIVAKAIRKSPADRYATVIELADDLRSYLANKPIKAKPPTWRESIAKWTRRHPAAFWSAVLALLSTTLVTIIGAALIVAAYNRESQQRQTAEANARQAEAVSKFLVDVLRSPDPQQDGRTVTIAEVLDRAVAELKGWIGVDPSVKAVVLEAIGKTYQGLGLYRESVPLLEESHQLRNDLWGETDASTLKSLDDLATANLLAGESAKGVRLAEESVRLRKVSQGPTHADTLDSMGRLAEAYSYVERDQELLRLREEIYEIRNSAMAPDLPAIIRSMSDLAYAYLYVARYDDAVRLSEQAVRTARAKLDRDDPVALAAMDNLASAYYFAGRATDAVVVRKEVLALTTAKLGRDHSDTLAAMHKLSGSYREAGRVEEALQLAQATFTRMEAKFGPEHPDTIQCISNLGDALRYAGRLDEALAIHGKALELWKKRLGNNHGITQGATDRLSDTYRLAGQYDDALAFEEESLRLLQQGNPVRYRAVVAALNKVVGIMLAQGRSAQAEALVRDHVRELRTALRKDNPELARASSILSLVLINQGKYQEAEAPARDSLNVLEKHLPPNDWRISLARGLLGCALAGQKKFSSAEPLLLSAFDALQRRAKHFPERFLAYKPYLQEVIQSLDQLYESVGQSGKAAQWKQIAAGYDPPADDKSALPDDDP